MFNVICIIKYINVNARNVYFRLSMVILFYSKVHSHYTRSPSQLFWRQLHLISLDYKLIGFSRKEREEIST
jgi:hypothetical protein